MKTKIIILFLMFLSIAGLGQKTDTYTIAILGDKYIPENNKILNELKEEVKSVVGQSANIVFDESIILLNDLDAEKAQNNYEKMLESDQVDLILSFGAINNFVIAKNKEFPKPVILFGVINDDFITFPVGQTKSNTPNLTYILTPQSYKRDLLQFKEIYPYQKVGIIIDEYLTDIYPVQTTLDNIFKDIDAEYKLIPIENLNDFSGKLDDVDAIYLTGGIYFSKEDQRALVKIVNDKKLPSFTSLNEYFSEFGILLTSEPINNQEQFFRRIALNIEAAVNGGDLSQLPIYLDIESKLLFNIETAFKISFPLKYSFLLQMNIVGDADKIPYQKCYTLKDVANQILDQNLNLKAEKKNVDLASQDVKLAKSEYLPELTASAKGTHIDPELAKVSNGSNPEYSTSGNISLNQVLFSEQSSASIKIKKDLENVSRENYNAIEKDAILNAATAYYNALTAKANYLINDDNLRVTRYNFEIAQQKYSAGQTGKSDVLRWKSELAVATQNLVSSFTNLSQAFNELNLVLNNPIDLRIDILEDINEKDAQQNRAFFEILDNLILRQKLTRLVEDMAVENAHELKSVNFNISATERTEKLYQRSKFLPTISLQGQYNHTFTKDGEGSSYPTGIPSSPDGYYNVAVQMSLPIFQKNQRNLNRQRSFVQREQLNIQKEQTEDNIRKNVNDIMLMILSQYSNIELSKISTETAKESLELMQISYANGAIGITSLIDAQQAYFLAQQQQTNANYNFQLGLLQLERIMSYFFVLHTEQENQAFIQQMKNKLLTN